MLGWVRKSTRRSDKEQEKRGEVYGESASGRETARGEFDQCVWGRINNAGGLLRPRRRVGFYYKCKA